MTELSNNTIDETIIDEIPKVLAVLPLRDNVIFPLSLPGGADRRRHHQG